MRKFWIVLTVVTLIIAIVCAVFAFYQASIRPFGLSAICFWLVSVASFYYYQENKKK